MLRDTHDLDLSAFSASFLRLFPQPAYFHDHHFNHSLVNDITSCPVVFGFNQLFFPHLEVSYGIH